MMSHVPSKELGLGLMPAGSSDEGVLGALVLYSNLISPYHNLSYHTYFILDESSSLQLKSILNQGSVTRQVKYSSCLRSIPQHLGLWNGFGSNNGVQHWKKKNTKTIEATLLDRHSHVRRFFTRT